MYICVSYVEVICRNHDGGIDSTASSVSATRWLAWKLTTRMDGDGKHGVHHAVSTIAIPSAKAATAVAIENVSGQLTASSSG